MQTENRDSLLAGVDEAGRGCLAGPVVAAAVIFKENSKKFEGLTDSKKMSASAREKLALEIKKDCLTWGLGLSWPREIESVNILQATMLAMQRAVKSLKITADQIVVDGNRVPDFPVPARYVIKGDLLIPVISAASVIAKTFRDSLMTALDRRYPGYALSQHKGYGTKKHLKRLAEIGPSPLHRKTFRGVLPPREVHLCLPLI